MPKPPQTWKKIERDVAKASGGKRKIDKGKHEEAEDIEHPIFSIEVKYRNRMPSPQESYNQAHRNATAGKVPLVIYRYKKDQRMYAILDLQDLLKLTRGGEIDAIITDSANEQDA